MILRRIYRKRQPIDAIVLFCPITDRLQDKCQDGEWCLSDDWLLISDNNEYLDFCYTGLCLRDNMPDECLDEVRLLNNENTDIATQRNYNLAHFEMKHPLFQMLCFLLVIVPFVCVII